LTGFAAPLHITLRGERESRGGEKMEDSVIQTMRGVLPMKIIPQGKPASREV